jgi:hypothetical protein
MYNRNGIDHHIGGSNFKGNPVCCCTHVIRYTGQNQAYEQYFY